jgi:hypothetical protein
MGEDKDSNQQLFSAQQIIISRFDDLKTTVIENQKAVHDDIKAIRDDVSGLRTEMRDRSKDASDGIDRYATQHTQVHAAIDDRFTQQTNRFWAAIGALVTVIGIIVAAGIAYVFHTPIDGSMSIVGGAFAAGVILGLHNQVAAIGVAFGGSASGQRLINWYIRRKKGR